MPPLELGLIGATAIAQRVLCASQVRAVAASDPVRAKEYASAHGIPVVHETYSALLADPEINAVYVSLHSSAHHRWAVRAALAGKHVIVEKPLCLTANEVAEIEYAAAEGGVQVVEAVASAGQEWQEAVRAMVVDEPYGRLQRVETAMAFADPVDGNYRRYPELGGGIFFDAASYWLEALQSTIGLDDDDVVVEGRSDFEGPHGIDYVFRASLRWPGGAEAVLTARFGDRHVSDHLFVFERATVKMRNFLRPMAGTLPLNVVVQETRRRVIAFPAVSYYERQLSRIRTLVAGDPISWPGQLSAAIRRIELMDDIYRDARSRHE
ncbi:Gfo/Idh/MocA family oxidoreductase [Kribbella sp. NBC_01245]|uniref:Gfo/Idh/MocA family protein n=1 Tax=Kribbella sp. NBC_01245 TaxID=2903578 RepID=UPI002E2A4887|nr:Gfo/Idh/MocA family oxidoreductase [Kribbella sp. NBC_01245]